MLRKLTGIFILLCFLLVKNNPLFVSDATAQWLKPATSSAPSGITTAFSSISDPQQANSLLLPSAPLTVPDGESESQDGPDETKSSEQFECADEDVIGQLVLNFNPVLPLSSGLDIHYNKQTSTAYYSLPYPPPDYHS